MRRRQVRLSRGRAMTVPQRAAGRLKPRAGLAVQTMLIAVFLTCIPRPHLVSAGEVWMPGGSSSNEYVVTGKFAYINETHVYASGGALANLPGFSDRVNCHKPFAMLLSSAGVHRKIQITTPGSTESPHATGNIKFYTGVQVAPDGSLRFGGRHTTGYSWNSSGAMVIAVSEDMTTELFRTKTSPHQSELFLSYALDSDGNFYGGGEVWLSLYATADGGNDLLVVRVDTAGNIDWGVQMVDPTYVQTPAGDHMVSHVAVHGDSVYAAIRSDGDWANTVNGLHTNQGGFDAGFLVLDKANGAVQRLWMGGSAGNDYVSVVVFANGVMYAAMSCGASFNGQTAYGGNDFVLMAIDSDTLATVHWTWQYGGAGADSLTAVDYYNGYLYAVGYADADISGFVGYSGGLDAVLVKLAAETGALEWGYFGGNSGDQYAYQVKVFDEYNIYIQGRSDSAWFTAGGPWFYGGAAEIVMIRPMCGQYLLGPSIGSSTCGSLCAAGTWSAGTTCVACAAGTRHIANTPTCETCEGGTYSEEGSTECSTCPAGTYSEDGSGSCTECPAGYYGSDAGATSCQPCDIGYYTDAAGLTECKACAEGLSTLEKGSSSCTGWGLGDPETAAVVVAVGGTTAAALSSGTGSLSGMAGAGGTPGGGGPVTAAQSAGGTARAGGGVMGNSGLSGVWPVVFSFQLLGSLRGVSTPALKDFLDGFKSYVSIDPPWTAPAADSTRRLMGLDLRGSAAEDKAAGALLVIAMVFLSIFVVQGLVFGVCAACSCAKRLLLARTLRAIIQPPNLQLDLFIMLYHPLLNATIDLMWSALPGAIALGVIVLVAVMLPTVCFIFWIILVEVVVRERVHYDRLSRTEWLADLRRHLRRHPRNHGVGARVRWAARIFSLALLMGRWNGSRFLSKYCGTLFIAFRGKGCVWLVYQMAGKTCLVLLARWLDPFLLSFALLVFALGNLVIVLFLPFSSIYYNIKEVISSVAELSLVCVLFTAQMGLSGVALDNISFAFLGGVVITRLLLPLGSVATMVISILTKFSFMCVAGATANTSTFLSVCFRRTTTTLINIGDDDEDGQARVTTVYGMKGMEPSSLLGMPLLGRSVGQAIGSLTTRMLSDFQIENEGILVSFRASLARSGKWADAPTSEVQEGALVKWISLVQDPEQNRSIRLGVSRALRGALLGLITGVCPGIGEVFLVEDSLREDDATVYEVDFELASDNILRSMWCAMLIEKAMNDGKAAFGAANVPDWSVNIEVTKVHSRTFDLHSDDAVLCVGTAVLGPKGDVGPEDFNSCYDALALTQSTFNTTNESNGRNGRPRPPPPLRHLKLLNTLSPDESRWLPRSMRLVVRLCRDEFAAACPDGPTPDVKLQLVFLQVPLWFALRMECIMRVRTKVGIFASERALLVHAEAVAIGEIERNGVAKAIESAQRRAVSVAISEPRQEPKVEFESPFEEEPDEDPATKRKAGGKERRNRAEMLSTYPELSRGTNDGKPGQETTTRTTPRRTKKQADPPTL